MLRLFGHMKRIKIEDSVKTVYLTENEHLNRRGRPLVRWNDRVGGVHAQKRHW